MEEYAGVYHTGKYYLMTKKIYSRRFATDCYSEFYARKALRSAVGLNDLPEYASERASFLELEMQNSYFIHDLLETEQREKKRNKDQ